MPHIPGHTSKISPNNKNGNQASMKVYGTNEAYVGRTVRIGGFDYTTIGGALEGTSVQLVPMGNRNQNNNTKAFGDDLGLDDFDLSLPSPSRLTNQNNSTRGFGDDLGLDNPNRIPKKFQGAMNYRCTFSIQIRKNLINADSPKVLQSKHELKTALGRFSFSKASISTPANSGVGYIFSPTGVPVNPPQILKRGS